MSAKTTIEWTDRTWNPVRGCSMVSEGCRNCYAMKVATRFSGPGQPYEGLAAGGKWTGKVRLIEEALDEPLRWRKPQRIFVNSMSDLFHEGLSDMDIARVFRVMACATLECKKRHEHDEECWTGDRHTFQILTKRPRRMLDWIQKAPNIFAENFNGDEAINLAGELGQWPLKNVWLGVSVEDQKAADERIPFLCQTPAAVRFLSCEPLLGPINLYAVKVSKLADENLNKIRAAHSWANAIHWVIVGGESGPGARPMHPDWVRDIRGQCLAANIPFFFKQWGEFVQKTSIGKNFCKSWFEKVGKKAAGSLLDGRPWREFPK